MPRTKPKTESGIQERVAKLKAEQDQLQKEQNELDKQSSKLRSRIREISDEVADLTNPWNVGDIVEDELGVRYRVTNTRGYGPNRVSGIRLNKNGTEAYAKERPIYSTKLTKVEVGE